MDLYSIGLNSELTDVLHWKIVGISIHNRLDFVKCEDGQTNDDHCHPHYMSITLKCTDKNVLEKIKIKVFKILPPSIVGLLPHFSNFDRVLNYLEANLDGDDKAKFEEYGLHLDKQYVVKQIVDSIVYIAEELSNIAFKLKVLNPKFKERAQYVEEQERALLQICKTLQGKE